MSTPVSLVCLLSAALAVVPIAPQEKANRKADQEDERSSDARAARPVAVRFERNGEVVEILCDGLEVKGRLNGKVLDPEQIVITGAEVRLRGEADDELAVVELEPQVERFTPPQKQRVQRIGVVVQPIGEPLAAQLDIETGLLVIGVEEGLPAEAAGLQVHDVVTHLRTELPATQEALERSLAEAEAGEAIGLTVRRRGDTLRLAVVPKTVEVDLTHESWTHALPQVQQWVLANQLLKHQAVTVRPEVRTQLVAKDFEWSFPNLATIAGSTTPAASGEEETLEQRLGKIEAQLARIEKLLEGLSEKR